MYPFLFNGVIHIVVIHLKSFSQTVDKSHYDFLDVSQSYNVRKDKWAVEI